MRASLDASDDDVTSAIPVAPVKIDLGLLKAPLFSRRDRLRFVALVALCLGLHAALLLLLESPPQVTPIEEAIPVEVIIEPPPEEAAPETAKPEEPPKAEEAPAQTVEEKPATDFARSADQDLEDGKASEKATVETKEPEAKPPEQKEAEVEPPQPEPTPELPAEPPPPPKKPAPRFAGLTPLPDFEFKAPLAKRSDLPKGAAEPGYLTTLYGLIMRKMPTLPNQTRPGRGRVTFAIMSNGAVIQETIAIPSGAPFLDAAALGAVRRAAPYPPPPKGGPVYIRFDYGAD